MEKSKEISGSWADCLHDELSSHACNLLASWDTSWLWPLTDDERQGQELMAEFRRQDAELLRRDAAQVTRDAYAEVRKNLLYNAKRHEGEAKRHEDEAKRLRELAKALPEVKNG